jgi:hypothetical protein
MHRTFDTLHYHQFQGIAGRSNNDVAALRDLIEIDGFVAGVFPCQGTPLVL